MRLSSVAAKGLLNKKTLFSAVLAVCLYLLLETSSFYVLLYLRQTRDLPYSPLRVASISEKHSKILTLLLQKKSTYLIYSSTLGWTIKENGSSSPYRANSQGIRANRECPPFIFFW